MTRDGKEHLQNPAGQTLSLLCLYLACGVRGVTCVPVGRQPCLCDLAGSAHGWLLAACSFLWQFCLQRRSQLWFHSLLYRLPPQKLLIRTPAVTHALPTLQGFLLKWTQRLPCCYNSCFLLHACKASPLQTIVRSAISLTVTGPPQTCSSSKDLDG